MSEFIKLTMTAKEAAAALSVSLPTFYQLASSEGFPAIRVGRKIIVNADGLQRWIESNHGRSFS